MPVMAIRYHFFVPWGGAVAPDSLFITLAPGKTLPAGNPEQTGRYSERGGISSSELCDGADEKSPLCGYEGIVTCISAEGLFSTK